MVNRKIGVLLAAIVALAAAVATSGASASSPDVQVVSDSSIHVSTATIGGAPVLSTTNTVAHWHGSSVNPDDGVTYEYNMVGKDPSLEQTSNIATDIIPVNVVVGGMTFTAGTASTGAVKATLDSPVFTNNDYTSTDFVTNTSSSPLPQHNSGHTAGGLLSSGNTSNQLEDATMRSQFNKQGTGYHVNLSPVNTWSPITIVVPQGKGTLLTTGRQVIAGDVSISWWAGQLQSLNQTLGVDPTHLPIYLTNNVMLFIGNNPLNCCVIGFHGAGIVPGNSAGPVNGKGNQSVQTYAWASYVTPGFFGPISNWALQDIHALSHEIAEWGDDPFVNNYVEPWLTPTAPQYGCTGILETGDPVVGIGFALGTNTFEQGPTPNGTQVADGYYHPEDEVFLPWFMRTSPNTTSQFVQGGSDGRYTLMGNLNQYPGFQTVATGC